VGERGPGRLGRRAAGRVLPAAALALLTCAFVSELWRHLGAAGDFWTLWAAARAVGAGLDPYVPGSLLRVAPLPAPAAPGPFLSPLFVAQAMRPLGALSFGEARLVWLALSLALSGGLVSLLLRQAGFRTTWLAVAAGAGLLMAFQPYDITLWLGQTDVLVVTALAAGWLCLERGRPFLGGVAVALAAVDVHLLFGFGFYLLFRAVARRDSRPLAGMAAGLLALAAACLMHPADLQRWLLVTLPNAQVSAIEPWDTLSALQAASELLGRHAGWIAAAALDAGLVTLAVRAWMGRAATPQRDLAVAAVLTLVTTSFAYNQDYLLLVLAFPFVARQWRGGVPRAWTGALAFALAVGFGLAELTGGPVAPSHAAFIIGAPLLALGALACLAECRAGSGPGDGLWAGAWIAVTVGGYAAFTASRYELGAELVMLAGVLAFMALVGLAPERWAEPGRPSPERAGAWDGAAGSAGVPGPARGGPAGPAPAAWSDGAGAPAAGRGGSQEP